MTSKGEMVNTSELEALLHQRVSVDESAVEGA